MAAPSSPASVVQGTLQSVQAQGQTVVGDADALLTGAAPVPGWLVWVLAALLVLLLAAIAVVIWRAARPRQRTKAARPVEGASFNPLGRARTALGRQFAAARRTLRGMIGDRRDYVYRTPLYLTLGPAGAGKTTLARALSETAGGGEEPLVTHEGDDCRFWFFDQGILMDLNGQAIAGPDGGRGDDRLWKDFATQLERHRPKRPLDGVVLTLPADRLMDAKTQGTTGLLRLTASLRERLTEVQRRIGMRPTVSVVITKADAIPGFGALAGGISSDQRRQMLGWSSPFTTDTAFQKRWVDDAMGAISAASDRAVMELMASRSPESLDDRAFLFAGELQRLTPILGEALADVFKSSTYQDPVIVRGLYLTGIPDLVDDSAYRPMSRDDVAAGPTRLAFVHDLFLKKIFPESGLSQPVGRILRTTNRRVRAMQIGVVAMSLILFISLGLTVPRLNADAALVRGIAKETTANLAEKQRILSANQLPDTPTFQRWSTDLLGHMSLLQDDTLVYAAIPISWHGWLRDRVISSIRVTFKDIVVKGLVLKMKERANAIAAMPRLPGQAGNVMPVVDAAPSELPAFQDLRAYVGRVNTLDQHVVLYNSLPEKGDPQIIGSLVLYLYNYSLPQEFFTESAIYDAALNHIDIQPFATTPFAPGMARQVRTLTDDLKIQLFQQGTLSQKVGFIQKTLSEMVDPTRLEQVDIATLTALADAIASLRAMVTSPQYAWAGQPVTLFQNAFSGLLDQIAASPFLGPTVADDLRASMEEGLQNFQDDMLGRQVPRLGPVLAVDEQEQRLRLTDPMRALEARLNDLLARAFVAGRSGGPRTLPAYLPGDHRVTWKASQLQDALDLYNDWTTYQTNESMQRERLGIRDVDEPVRDAARTRLISNMVSEITEAMAITPQGSWTTTTALEGEVAAEADNLAKASPHLRSLLDAFTTLNASREASALTSLVVGQAESILRRTDTLLENSALYGGDPQGFGWWDGTQPPAYQLMGVTDRLELAQALGVHRERVAWLANNYAQPAVEFLMNRAIDLTLVDLSVVSRWQRVLIELDRYTRKLPVNSITALNTLITGPLSTVTSDTCAATVAGLRQASDSLDWFERKRTELIMALERRCRGYDVAATTGGVGSLVGRFAGGIGKLFPFSGALPRGPADEATDSQVRAFLTSFNDALNLGLADPLNLSGFPGGGTAVRQFLDQLDAVRAFLDAGRPADKPDAPPSYTLIAKFRTDRGHEAYGNHIIEWTLSTGGQTISSLGTETDVTWSYGAPISLTLRWARNAPTQPAPATGSAAAALSIQPQRAEFRYDGNWGLFAFLRAHDAVIPGAVLGGPGAKTLVFTVPVAKNPDAPPVQGPVPLTDKGPEARVYMELTVMSPAKPVQQVLQVPEFSIEAPQIQAQNSR